MGIVLLVRHGRSTWNEKSIYQGQKDPTLSEEGIRQMELAGQALPRVDKIYTSPLKRARMSAEILSGGRTPIEVVEEFIEISHGEWEGMRAEDVERRFEDLLMKWRERPSEVQMPGGESLKDVWERAVPKFEEIAKEDGIFCIVSHDVPLRAMVCHSLGLGMDDIWRFRLSNGGITAIEWNGKFEVLCLNSTCHLGGLWKERDKSI